MKEQWKVGEILLLGHYQQNRANSSEPVEWTILKVDGERALVTSLYALDAQPFHTSVTPAAAETMTRNDDGTVTLKNLIPSGFQAVTWENCTLRAWLNREFLEAAFSPEERKCLLETDALKDRVTLLALDENINDAKQFPTDASTGCRATPYAASLYKDDIEADRQERATRPLPPRASYWLKSKGIVIHGDNMEGVMGVSCMRLDLAGKLAVRPALLLDLNVYEELLEGESQASSFLGRLFKRKTPIAHRFNEVKNGGVIETDLQNHKVVSDGIGSPDLYLEFPVHGQLNEQTRQAITLCLASAIMGDPKAQNSVGTLFWNGEVLVQSYQEANKWNQYAANQGLPEAMVDLADAYFNGKGVETDYRKAFAYCLKAAEAGFTLGMQNVAKCYANGWGTEQDLEKALEWSRKASNADISIADEQKTSQGSQKTPSDSPDCRNAQPNKNTTGKKIFYTANCSCCGKEIRLPFEPKHDRPVYCSKCFDKLNACK